MIWTDSSHINMQNILRYLAAIIIALVCVSAFAADHIRVAIDDFEVRRFKPDTARVVRILVIDYSPYLYTYCFETELVESFPRYLIRSFPAHFPSACYEVNGRLYVWPTDSLYTVSEDDLDLMEQYGVARSDSSLIAWYVDGVHYHTYYVSKADPNLFVHKYTDHPEKIPSWFLRRVKRKEKKRNKHLADSPFL